MPDKTTSTRRFGDAGGQPFDEYRRSIRIGTISVRVAILGQRSVEFGSRPGTERMSRSSKSPGSLFNGEATSGHLTSYDETCEFVSIVCELHERRDVFEITHSTCRDHRLIDEGDGHLQRLEVRRFGQCVPTDL